MRPLNSRYFGPGVGKIAVRFHNGTAIVDGYIIKQLGTSSYRVSDGSVVKDCTLVQTTAKLSSLTGKECAITMSTANGVQVVKKLMMNRALISGPVKDVRWSSNSTAQGHGQLAKLNSAIPVTGGGAPVVTLKSLSLSGTNGTVSSALSINIVGAAAGSTITGTVPDGMVLNSAARTITGTPTTAGTYSFSLVETLAGSPNSPRSTAVTIAIAVGASQPTTLQSSVMYQGATYNFSTPVPVGTYVGGQPFVVSDRAFSITSISPNSSAITGSFVKGGVAQSGSYLANGAMVNPYLNHEDPSAFKQGFDGLLAEYQDDATFTANTTSGNTSIVVTAVSSGANFVSGAGVSSGSVPSGTKVVSQTSGTPGGVGVYVLSAAPTVTATGATLTLAAGPSAAATCPFDATLNKDPATAGAFAVSIGDSKSIVKSIRRPNLTSPVSWRTFDNWSVLHIVSSTPAVGALPPSASSTDKSTPFTTNNWNRAALGTGFALPGSMPTFATTESGGYFARGFQPWFGMHGEVRRRAMVLDYGLDDTGYSGNFAGFAIYWSDWMIGLLSQGQSANDAHVIRALEFGSQLYGLKQRGFLHNGGAGQNLGHKMFAQMFGHFFPSTMPTMLGIQSNATHQPEWITSAQVGMKTNGFGVTSSNHDVNRGTYYPEHVGKPMWFGDTIRNSTSPEHDSNLDQDYEQVSSPGMMSELLAISALRAGPSGADGLTALLQGGAFNTTNQYAAAIGYMDRVRTYPTSGYVLSPFNSRHGAVYDAIRTSSAVPKWTGTPDSFTPSTGSGSYLSAVTNGFKVDYSSIHLATEAVTQMDIRYSLDMRTWITINGYTNNTSVTGLPAGVKVYVQVRRRSASGIGPWSVNYPYKTAGAAYEIAERMVVTTGGTASGTVANDNGNEPKIVEKLYKAWAGPEFTSASPTKTVGDVLYAAKGWWTGNITGAWTYQFLRDGVAITGATSDSYTVTSADVGKLITCTVTQGGVSVTSAAIGIPNIAFSDTVDAPLNTMSTSSMVTVAGLVGPSTISVVGGEYRLNGGAWTSTSGTIAVGDTLQLRATSANTSGGIVSMSVTVGTATTGWKLYSAFGTFPVVRFDGTNDGLLRSSALVGEIDTTQFTFAAYVQMMGGDGATQVLFDMGPTSASAQARLRISRVSTTNLVQVLGRNSAATILVSRNSTTALTAASGLKRVMVAVDLTAGVCQMYFDNTDVSPSSGTLTSDVLDLGDGANSLEAVGMTVAQTAKMNANLTYLWFHPTFIDLSVQANRDKFLPGNVGSTGLGPLGATPQVFLLGNAAGYADGSAQKGSGGPFVIVGDGLTDV